MAIRTRGSPPGLRWATHSSLLAALLLLNAHATADDTDLTELSLEQLLDVEIVSASKYAQKQSEVAAASVVITRAEIDAFGWRTLDAVLGSLPGVHTTYDRQYTYVGTRGFGLPGDYNTRLLITINGNRVNDVAYDSALLGVGLPIDLDFIERIEFVPGPGGAVYGQNAMFGVVNLITRTGASFDGTELAVRTEPLRELRSGRASWGQRLDNGLDLAASVSRMQARGQDHFYEFNENVAGEAKRVDGERDRELFAQASLGGWSFDTVYGDRWKEDPTGSYLSDPLVAGQYQADSYAMTQLEFASGTEGDADVIQFVGRVFAGQERYRSVLVYDTPFRFRTNSDWYGAEMRLLLNALDRHRLMVGIEAQDNERADQTVEDLAAPENSVVIASSGYRVGVFAQDEWTLTPTLAATLGVRLDRNDFTGSDWSPRAGLIWHPQDALTLKALYGRAHRAPNAYERDYDDGFAQVANPALNGETIDTVELVADYRWRADLGSRVSVYRWVMSDLISLGLDSVSGVTQYQSGGDVKARGVEASVTKAWDIGVRMRGSVSYQDVQDAQGQRLPNSPHLLGRLNVSGQLPWWGLAVGYDFRYDAERRTVDGADVSGFAVSNITVSGGEWINGLTVSVSIQNVFDADYEHPAADTNWQRSFEQDGRSVRAALEFKL